MTIRWQLMEIMARHRVQVKDLAATLGISKNAVSDLRQADTMPRIDGKRLAQICSAITQLSKIGERVDPSDLIEYIAKDVALENIGLKPESVLKLKDIPQYTSWGNYKFNVSWHNLEYTLNKHITLDDLDLDPDFQRDHVWDVEKQLKYVEHILKGGLSGRDVLFNHPGWHKSFDGAMVLVDGKQRLEAARRFLRNDLKVFGKYTYSQIEKNVSGPRYEFIFHVNDLQTRAEVLQWYLDLNSGGVVHTQKELDKVRELLLKEHEAASN